MKKISIIVIATISLFPIYAAESRFKKEIIGMLDVRYKPTDSSFVLFDPQGNRVDVGTPSSLTPEEHVKLTSEIRRALDKNYAFVIGPRDTTFLFLPYITTPTTRPWIPQDNDFKDRSGQSLFIWAFLNAAPEH